MILAPLYMAMLVALPGGRISVNILSRPVRLLHEAGGGSLEMEMPAVRVSRDGNHDVTHQPGTVRLILRGDRFYVTGSPGAELTGRRIRFDPCGDSDEWQVAVDGKKRTYPLPLEIDLGDDEPSLAVSEDISRYSLDSALAETGGYNPCEREAVMALAHLVRARCLQYLVSPAHGRSHFCDLTHCQQYRGRITGKKLEDTWDLLPGKTRVPFLFHGSCGGRTLGPAVFTANGPTSGVRDILVSSGASLCGSDQAWERTHPLKDLLSDLGIPGDGTCRLERKDNGIRITSSAGTVLLPLETFRLGINRRRGWSFIRSNLYTMEMIPGPGEPAVRFTGRGLGHGVGLCQEGAMSLARMGFSRYEILCHYFPGCSYTDASGGIPPVLSWCSFDLLTGKITGGDENLLMRTIPPGSLAKIITALYLAERRPDLLSAYRYTCSGTYSGGDRTVNCWDRNGHGVLDCRGAIASSCNLYFYSMKDRIDPDDYARFCRELSERLSAEFPSVRVTDRHLAGQRMAGLDFSVSWRMKDILSLVLYLGRSFQVEEGKAVSPASLVLSCLHGTFREGTASGRETRGTYVDLLPPSDRELDAAASSGDFWGKTSTMIHGTNNPTGYGLFAGGDGNRGIIAILRGGTGHCAARWSLYILRHDKKQTRR